MNNQGITSNNNNEITEEGTTSNNNDVKEGLNSTSNNNDISEDHVPVFVAYNGKWEYDGKEWFFKNFKMSMMVVPKHITLSEIIEILHKQLEVDKEVYRLKLEVHYRTGCPWFPVIEIQNDQDLSVFISETSRTKLPLCVTLLDEIIRFNDDEERRKDNKAEKRLIKAIRKNDRVKAREIINTEEVTWTSKLNDEGHTALHYAVCRYRDNEVFKEILMGINSEELLTIVDNKMSHPAHTAALFGNTEALKIMLDSNLRCLFVPDDDGRLPIHLALELPAIKTFLYLFKQMKSYEVEYDYIFGGIRGLNLLHQVINTGFIDIAYYLINDFPVLATMEAGNETTLECIVRRPDLFYSGAHYNLFERFVYSHIPIENNNLGSTNTADVENQETPNNDKYTRRCLHDVISRIYYKLWQTTLLHVTHIKHLKYDKEKHNTTIKLLRRICEEADRTYTESDIERLYSSPFCLAVENNTPEVVDVLTTNFEGLLYNSKNDGRNIYQLIVLNRSEKVFRYILHHEHFAKSGFSVSLDDDDNNILHLAGRLAPMHILNAVSGAALQMQRELRWFEEVKKVVGIAHTRALNKNKETPMMVFRRQHMELRKDGEEWMKRTADSYTVTAALIIAICFAAAITVPGGNDDKTGKPIYETKASLTIFAISNAVSLFTSTTSLLSFLSVITARYADEDFLYKLPKRLILGLVLLFVSAASMMIAFSAALYIMFGQGKPWILIPIVALAYLPYTSFVMMAQSPLLLEIISSTYGQALW